MNLHTVAVASASYSQASQSGICAQLHPSGWAIRDESIGKIMDVNGRWDWESSPYGQNEEYRRQHRFPDLLAATTALENSLGESLPSVADFIHALDEVCAYIEADLANGVQMVPDWQETVSIIRSFISTNRLMPEE